MAARRQALRQAVRHQLAQHYQLDEVQTQRLFAQWSRQVFRQLLARDGMCALDLEAALTNSLLL